MTAPAFVDDIFAAIRRVIGDRGDFVALHEPCFRGREWEYVKDCLDTGWVSSPSKPGSETLGNGTYATAGRGGRLS